MAKVLASESWAKHKKREEDGAWLALPHVRLFAEYADTEDEAIKACRSVVTATERVKDQEVSLKRNKEEMETAQQQMDNSTARAAKDRPVRATFSILGARAVYSFPPCPCAECVEGA